MLVRAPKTLSGEIVILRSVETILGGDSPQKSSFKYCLSTIKSLRFEEFSKISRISSFAFSTSSLETVDFSNCNYLLTLNNSVFSNCIKLSSIVLPPKIETLGNGVFSGTTSLKSINFPDSLQNINGWTSKDGNPFSPSLEEVIISSNSQLTYVGSNAFIRSKLKSFYIPQYCIFESGSVLSFAPITNLTIHPSNAQYKVENEVIYSGENNNTLFYVSSAKRGGFKVPSFIKIINHACLRGCQVTSFILNDECEEIRSYFLGDSKITEFKCNRLLTSIPSTAFSECSVLETVVLTENITKIESYAFQYCYRLKNIILPKNLSFIGIYAFSSCRSLTYLKLPPNNLTIGNAAFTGCANLEVDSSENPYILIKDWMLFQDEKKTLTEYFGSTVNANITIPEECRLIGDKTFNGAKIHSMTFASDNNIVINPLAFSHSTLRSIIFRSGLKSIGNNCFGQCLNLTKVDLSLTAITEIPDNCFAQCYELNDIKLPSTIQKIGMNAFLDCAKLGNIGLENTVVTHIKDYAFYSSGLSSANLPSTISSLGIQAFKNSKIQSLTVSCDIPAQCFMSCSSLETINLNDGVATIYENAFESCASLKNLVLPSTIKLIRSFAFQFCSMLDNLTLSLNSNLEDIFGGTFVGCDRLKQINLDPNDKNFKFTNGALTNYNESILITYCSIRDGFHQKLCIHAVQKSSTNSFQWKQNQNNQYQRIH